MFSTVSSSGYFSATSNYVATTFFSFTAAATSISTVSLYVATMHPAVKFNDVKVNKCLLHTYLSPLETLVKA